MSKSKCKKVYYARCISDYNKEFDNYCIDQLTNLGFEVVDPNIFFDKDEYEDKGMKFFYEKIKECDALFFKSLTDGRITAGVYKEVLYAKHVSIPTYEITNTISKRVMDVEQTRNYLKDKGIRK
jgi:hypothetical protein